jgi:hypothetical protein
LKIGVIEEPAGDIVADWLDNGITEPGREQWICERVSGIGVVTVVVDGQADSVAIRQEAEAGNWKEVRALGPASGRSALRSAEIANDEGESPQFVVGNGLKEVFDVFAGDGGMKLGEEVFEIL